MQLTAEDVRSITADWRNFVRGRVGAAAALLHATFLIVAAKDDEKETLRINFEEGVRDSAEDIDQFKHCMRLLDEAVRDQELKTQS